MDEEKIPLQNSFKTCITEHELDEYFDHIKVSLDNTKRSAACYREFLSYIHTDEIAKILKNHKVISKSGSFTIEALGKFIAESIMLRGEKP